MTNHQSKYSCLQSRDDPHHFFSVSGGQGLPPRRACVSTLRVRVDSPMLHVVEHSDHSPHSPTTQCRVPPYGGGTARSVSRGLRVRVSFALFSFYSPKKNPSTPRPSFFCITFLLNQTGLSKCVCVCVCVRMARCDTEAKGRIKTCQVFAFYWTLYSEVR